MSITRETDNVYLNVVFNSNPNLLVTPATYSEAKTTPIVNKASDYYLSVIRFTIPLSSIPIFIMPVIPFTNNTGPVPPNSNTTPFTIAIQYQGVSYSQTIQYVPDNMEPIPIQNNPNAQIITQYYYVYSFQNLIDAVNLALFNAFTAFKGANPLAPQVVGGQAAPFFVYTPSTNLFSLICSINWGITGPTEAQIVINNQLTSYFIGFRLTSKILVPLPGTILLGFVIEYTGDNAFFPAPPIEPGAEPTYIRVTQDFAGSVYWSSLRSLVITSNSLNVRAEGIPFITGNGIQSGQSNFKSIISDFVPNLDLGYDDRSIAYYNPTSQYRLIDLISDNPIVTIDITILWQDKLGNLYPLFILQGQQASIKLGFFNKKLYKQGNLNLKM